MNSYVNVVVNQEFLVYNIKNERVDTIMEKKLYKSQTDRKICGVCGGIAEYFHIDPTVIRLIWALCACGGFGIVAYIVAAIVMPD